MVKGAKAASLPRFYVKPNEVSSQNLLIAGEEAHHLRSVLRLKKGDFIAAFDGQGKAFRAQIKEILKDQVRAEIIETNPGEGESFLTLHLVQALLRAEKMDWVIQKAVELGVSRITPLSTRRSLIKLTAENTGHKKERWQKIARQAAKQCGRSFLPVVEPPAPWEQWIKSSWAEQGRFFFNEGEKKKRLKILGRKMRGINTAMVVLGPEGGWEPEEVQTLEALGFLSLSLGPRILRAETAAVAALTLMQHLFGDLS
jgi:16S rRNA (uracil1498-N3)-methyltransferase